MMDCKMYVVTDVIKDKALEMRCGVLLSIAMQQLLCHLQACWVFLAGQRDKKNRAIAHFIRQYGYNKLNSCQVTPSY